MNKPTEVLDRRSFCAACAAGLGTLACGGGGGGSTSTPPPTPPNTTTVTTTETKAGFLAAPAGTVRDYRGAGNCFLVRDATGIYAMSSTCTHQGCTVNTAGSGFNCPCHGSSYNLNGGNTGGPAPTPLPHYEVREASAGGALVIDTTKTVGADVRLT